MYDELVAELSEQIAIVTAQEASLEDLNRLIARSKAYWDWPEEYLSRAIPLHRIYTLLLEIESVFRTRYETR